jgi:hypothetical protein
MNKENRILFFVSSSFKHFTFLIQQVTTCHFKLSKLTTKQKQLSRRCLLLVQWMPTSEKQKLQTKFQQIGYL